MVVILALVAATIAIVVNDNVHIAILKGGKK